MYPVGIWALVPSVKEENLPRGQRSFAAYNALLISDIDKESPSACYAQAYIRLYASSSDHHLPEMPGPDDRLDEFALERSYYAATRGYLRLMDMMPRTGYQGSRYSIRFDSSGNLLRDEVGVRQVQRRSPSEDEAAIEGLRFIRGEVLRIQESRRNENRSEKGKSDSSLVTKDHDIDDDFTLAEREPPVRTNYETSLWKVNMEDFVNAAEGSVIEGICGDCLHELEPFRAEPVSESTKSVAPSTTPVKDEPDDVPVLNTPPTLSYPPEAKPFEVVDPEEPMIDVRRMELDDTAMLPGLEDIHVEDEADTVLVTSKLKPGEAKKSIGRILANLDYLAPEIDRLHEEEKLALLTLGTRAQIPTGYMVKTLRSQSTCDSNMPSDQMLSTF